MSKLVTRESIQHLLDTHPKSCDAMRIAVIGKALVRIFNHQTMDEKSDNTTREDNGIGFTGSDAKGGSLTAKYYLKHGTLLEWQVAKWMRTNPKGFSRITKYHRQLNEIAERQATIAAKPSKEQLPLRSV